MREEGQRGFAWPRRGGVGFRRPRSRPGQAKPETAGGRQDRPADERAHPESSPRSTPPRGARPASAPAGHVMAGMAHGTASVQGHPSPRPEQMGIPDFPYISETRLIRRYGVRGGKLFARLWFSLLYVFLIALAAAPATMTLQPCEQVLVDGGRRELLEFGSCKRRGAFKVRCSSAAEPA